MQLLHPLIISLPLLLGGFIQLVLSSFYTNYASDRLKIDIGLIGLFFTLSRLIDAFLDPLCGLWSDRLNNRKGFITAGLITIAVASFLLFPGTERVSPIAVGIGIFMTYIGITLVYVPHYAWLSARAKRTPSHTWFGLRAIIENLGTIAGGVALILVSDKNISDTAFLLKYLILIFALKGLISVLVQRSETENPPLQESSMFDAGVKLLKNKIFRYNAFMSFSLQFAATSLMTLTFFYVKHVLLLEAIGGVVTALFIISATLAIPYWMFLSRKISVYQIWGKSLFFAGVILPALWLAPFTGPIILYLTAIIVGALAGAVLIFMPHEISKTAERYQHSDGLIFAVFTFVNKTAMACPPLIISLILKLLDYDGTHGHLAVGGTKLAIAIMFVVLPAAGFLVSWLFFKKYRQLMAFEEQNYK